MKKYYLIILVPVLLMTSIFVVRFVFGGDEDSWICEEGSWVKHGNPSVLAPTSGCGNKEDDTCTWEGKVMSLEEVISIASIKCKEGKLNGNHYCNSTTGTWWFDLNMPQPKEGCNPACVVNIDTKEAEINWRCTGLLE